MSQPTCEERIDTRLASAMEDIRLALKDGPEYTFLYKCPSCDHEWESEDESEYECAVCAEELPEDYAPEEQHNEHTHDSYMEGVLEITPLYTVYRVGLSWGGPADGFYLYVDPEDRTIDKIEYYFQDWFDGATRVLLGEEFDLVRDMFESYIEIAEYERT